MRLWLAAGFLLALAAGGLTVADTAKAKQADGLIAELKAVGREGANNAKAAAAWKKLVALGTGALVPIASALDDDDLTSSNWLRPAFDAIAEAAEEGGKLPAAELEKFVTNAKNSPPGRRLAYEWLVKADAKAPARLLPKMLKDPSAELRRDAVALVITEAKGLSDKAAATKAYQRALSGACDDDQVDEIAQALKKLGVTVDVPKHFGFVTRWHVAGPFDHGKGVGWARAYPPERGVNLGAAYEGKDGKQVKWVEHTTTHEKGVVDLNKVVAEIKGAVAYAYAEVESPADQQIEVRAGCINGLKIFVNGKQVFARDEYHHGMRIDQYAAKAALRKGKNEILLKVCQNEQTEAWTKNWMFQLRLCDAVGSAVAFSQAKKEDK